MSETPNASKERTTILQVGPETMHITQSRLRKAQFDLSCAAASDCEFSKLLIDAVMSEFIVRRFHRPQPETAAGPPYEDKLIHAGESKPQSPEEEEGEEWKAKAAARLESLKDFSCGVEIHHLYPGFLVIDSLHRTNSCYPTADALVDVLRRRFIDPSKYKAQSPTPVSKLP